MHSSVSMVVRPALLFAFVLCVLTTPAAADPPEWFGTGTFESAPGEITGMAFHWDTLYAVGEFPDLDPDGTCYLAQYDGVEWTAVTGLPDERWVRLMPFRANLYLQSTQSRIYSWSGSSYYLFQTGPSLTDVWNDQLVLRKYSPPEVLLWDGYAGWTGIPLDHDGTPAGFFITGDGLFAQARTGDGDPCWGTNYRYYLYQYDNGTWVYTGWSDGVGATRSAEWQGQTWITWPGGRHLAYWDGSGWVDVIGSLQPPGVPTTGETTQLFEYDDKLLVQIGERLIEYDGSTFAPFVDFVDGSPNVVIHDGVDGWFGGDFWGVDGNIAHGFALHSGGSWSAPSVSGTGLESGVIALGEYEGEVILATSAPFWEWGLHAILTTNLDRDDALAQVVQSEYCYADNLGICQTWWGLVCNLRASKVRELVEFGGDLFALGGIADIDGLEVDGIAKWGGAAWAAVDHDQQEPPGSDVVPEQLFALREIDGVLWMAGYDDTPVVQQFDGSRFNDLPALRAELDALGSGCDYMRRYSYTIYSDGPYIAYGGPTVFDLIEFDGEVVLGTDEGLVSWDGATLDQLDTGWMDLAPEVCCIPHDGSSFNCPKVTALAVDSGVLYAAGWFGLETDTIRNIVRYEDGQWLPLGDGLNGEVMALVARNGNLIAGGHFSHAGTLEVNGLAMWDGSQWHAIDGGVADEFGEMTLDYNHRYTAGVEDLWLTDCGDLYVGGDFFEVGGVTTNHLGIWSAPSLLTGPDCGVVAAPSAPGNLRLAARPNPFNPSTEISFDLPKEAEIEIVVFDLAGRRVRTLESGRWTAGSHVSSWHGTDESGRRVASGVYVVRLNAGADSHSIRVVMVK